MSDSLSDWASSEGALGVYIREEVKKTLESYRAQPRLVEEHVNTEDASAYGGYADRQLLELIQNSADALAIKEGGGRIRVRLTQDYLYCADEGIPIDEDGITALMFARMSPKRGSNQIGRFGLGFKAVLSITDRPEFFSRAGSFYFDAVDADKRIRSIVPESKKFPVLRLPQAIDPSEAFQNDPILQRMAVWATNIVRLPLKSGAYDKLSEQITSFPPEFLLFVEHVKQLMFDTEESDLVLSICREGDHYLLSEGDDTTRWKLFEHTHQLSDEAHEDRRSVDDTGCVKITWAVPLDRIRDPGRFWAYYPTMTASLVAGILNAPWKTNEDRQNLLQGAYNEEMIVMAVDLIADSLSQLSTEEDPANHLDALPRRLEGDGELTTLLCSRLNHNLIDREVVPDQHGRLLGIRDINYPPRDLAKDVLERWALYPNRPLEWLHHSAVTRRRLATIDRIFDAASESADTSSLNEWLEALVVDSRTEKESIRASMVAIQVAALLPEVKRESEYLGEIALTASCEWNTLDPETLYFRGSRQVSPGENDLIHHQLEDDPETNKVLREVFGIDTMTSEMAFRKQLESHFENEEWEKLWKLSRGSNRTLWLEIIQDQKDWYKGWYENWYDLFCLRNLAGDWKPISMLLLPGPIVPSDASRDKNITIDIYYHEEDMSLLKDLGVFDGPRGEYDYKDMEPRSYWKYQASCYREYRSELTTSSTPRYSHMILEDNLTSGPLTMIKYLSEEGKACYTEALLNLEYTFKPWTLYHKTISTYPRQQYSSPAIDMLWLYGCIRLPYHGIVPLSDGLGDDPLNPYARRWLLEHPNSVLICREFGIEIEPNLELIGEREPQSLIDEWPGLREHVTSEYLRADLIRCDQVGFDDSSGYQLSCYIEGDNIYLLSKDDEDEELRAILQEIGVSLSDSELEQIISRQTPEDIASARDKIRYETTDAQRLLAAVGKDDLLYGLPLALQRILDRSILEQDGGLEIAEAAIATYDVGALREYKDSLARLDPPSQWAGGHRAVTFVQSLGFGVEWAGQRKPRRPQYVEVTGPYTLPELHDYQYEIANNLKGMLRGGQTGGGKRGLMSLPTGAGKTRVAVQAIIEAIKEGDYKGNVLWIADRDELCEQAVEAWRQVWSNLGSEAAPLRISRLWGGHRNPIVQDNIQHVIVATVQTLHNRISRQSYNDVASNNFRLVVFDEAHRSIAPTYTQVMERLGLGRARRKDQSFLIGLTATPYRGHNEDETERLVNRYGHNRLDAGVFMRDDPQNITRELQSTGVLAQADHESIEGGVFRLTDEEITYMLEKRIPWLPRRLEDDIGADTARTERIIEAYKTHIHGRSWPTLVFATSVDHAKTMAALLTLDGIKARSVDGTTHPTIRRKIVEDFRAGRIEVLVNYGVFAEGFDAPKTRAIMVARPVYSPNLYFQMIGRGLRGPKNGGNERCLILNVEDNIENYQEQLAFTELEWLWADGG